MQNIISSAKSYLPSSDLVLVSGSTGFLGTQVTLAYLKKGFKVRGTARSQDKADAWMAKHGKFENQLEWAIVKDVAEEGAFSTAIKGVTIVAHTASPFHFDVKDPEKDMLIPALNGTRQMLKAAASESSVKRMVVTSSFAAVVDVNAMPDVGTTYTDDVWNPATYDEAKKSDNPAFIYCASKKVAEEEAWRFVKEEKVNFSLSTICPPMIFGPPEQVINSMDAINTSSGAIWSIVDAKEIKDPGFPVWTDVRDIAELHVLATTEEVAKGQRYLCIAGHYHDTQVASIIRKNFPEQAHRVPEVAVTAGADHFKTDSSKVEKELGIKWIGFEQSVVDTARALFAIEKSLKK